MVTRKSRACASEFDYAGWKAWGSWRRGVDELKARAVEEAVEDDDDVKREDARVVPKSLFAPSVPEEKVWFGGAWVGNGDRALGARRRPKAFWKKDCWGTCDYPSECRWGKQFGAQQSQAQAVSVLPPPSPPQPVVNELEQKTGGKSLEKLPTTVKEVEMDSSATTTAQETKKKFTLDDLLESAKRRKRGSAGPPPSPLASNPPEAEQTQEGEGSRTHTL
jgi:hypothetical protein